MEIDYSLYLVTDSTGAILKGRHLPTIVKEAIVGGVTIVQYRDKTSDTVDLIRTAKEIHDITKAHSIPLLINDRVDVAIAVGAEGVHIGQDDIDIATARKLLGPKAIIGVTASSVDEALQAAKAGADYLGLGTVFATPTKENTKYIVGCSGIRQMLSALSRAGYSSIKTVCIGGINASNVQRVLYQSTSTDPSHVLNGVAVVSAIMAAQDPESAASAIKSLMLSPPPFARTQQPQDAFELTSIEDQIPKVVAKLAETGPLCHNMTNLVVQNIAANTALCIGASPIMSNNGLEAPDLANLGGALVINMGTVTPDGLSNYLQALAAYNKVGGPTLFDPVGAGATQQRKDAVKKLMAGGYFDVIKGNEGEIKTVAGTAGTEQQKGVDSGTSTLSLEQRAELVRTVARQERNVILMTGAVDVLSDGYRTLAIENGHKFLGAITGSGCCLGTTIASYLAVHRDVDRLVAALAGILHFEIAAEFAARREDVKGPGTFVPAFLDELWRIRESSKKGDSEWIKHAKVKAF